MNKQEEYDELLLQLAALIEGETEEMSVLANVSAALKERFGWFWVGFYLDRGDELRLGPFQGSVACMHIAYDKGMCGAAFSQRKSIVVPDVELFPGHIACSSLSRSEIVVPIFGHNGHRLSRIGTDIGDIGNGVTRKEADTIDIGNGVTRKDTDVPVGVLDIDSTELNTFDDTDRQNLERVCALLSASLYQ
ncbi:MAG: GAF domain-containing protein [Prevotella sp.]|nr:GAF domain-containing protein [Prevotella sp.]